MPRIESAFGTVEFSMPSYPESKVTIMTNVAVKEVAEAEKLTGELERAVYIASKMITDWNFDDADKVKLPITEENLWKFPTADIEALISFITPFLQKKTSKNTK